MRLNWDNLLTTETLSGRKRKVHPVDGRTPFDKDYYKIVFSAPFRRLQDKAQLFPLDSSDFVRTRLTHSIEVSSVARTLGICLCQKIKDNHCEDWHEDYSNSIPRILECAGLVHDLGNPPLGHAGESYIQQEISRVIENNPICKAIDYKSNSYSQYVSDFLAYEGNSQTFRILTHLQCMNDFYGLHLTAALLATVMKYPVSSTVGNKQKDPDIRLHKCGYFLAEEDEAMAVAKKTGLLQDGFIRRHPLTYLLEAADDIAYTTGDIEDGMKKHLFSIHELKLFFEEFNSSIGEDDNAAPLNDDKIQHIVDYMTELERDKSYLTNEKRIQAFRNRMHKLLIPAVIDAFDENYESIMTGSFNKELLLNSQVKNLRKCLKEFAKKRLINDKEIVAKEITGKKVLSNLISFFEEGLLRIVDGSINFDERIASLISEEYLKIFLNKVQATDYRNIPLTKVNIYYILLLITDQISGMTDSHCMTLYRKINGFY